MIHIAVTFDKNYIQQFCVLATSIVLTNAQNSITIHCLCSGVESDYLKHITKYFKQNGSKIIIYDNEVVRDQKFHTANQWTQAVYYRLYLPHLVSLDVDRLLYIDSDSIVVNDLKDLYFQNLNGYALGAVYDNYVKIQPLIDITEEGIYFNTGMMLIDVMEWKQRHITESCLDFITSKSFLLKYVDQCVLNAVVRGDWMRLPCKYNLLTSYIPSFYSRMERKSFIRDATIIHFTLKRPWKYLDNHPFEYIYNYYYKRSPLRHFRYVDYSFYKIVARLNLKVINWYLESPKIRMMWRKIKIKYNYVDSREK